MNENNFMKVNDVAKELGISVSHAYEPLVPDPIMMGGWGLWETVNGERQLTTECIENVILMMPFSGMAMWTFGVSGKVVWKSTKIAFIFSVSIEVLQLLLRLGTFQISDIVHNTVGGMLGGMVYIGAMKLRERLVK